MNSFLHNLSHYDARGFPPEQPLYPVSGFTSGNIFQPMNDDLPGIETRDDHPVPRKGICIRQAPIDDPNQPPLIPRPPNWPLETNKFYANLFLGEQNNSVWTHPYSVCWAKGTGNAQSLGLSISHIEPEQYAFGPNTETGAPRFMINPTGIQSIILSARELGPSTVLKTDSLEPFSVSANLAPAPGAPHVVTFPLVQGMGFVTAIYRHCTPLIQTSVFFRQLIPSRAINNGATCKYRILLEDGRTWLAYVTPASPAPQCLLLRQINNMMIEAAAGFSGTIQIVKLPSGNNDSVLDHNAGAYPISGTISATVAGNQAQYTLSWTKAGLPRPLIMFALPHHVASFDPSMKNSFTELRLQTTTKGIATAILADSWRMQEILQVDMGLAPWHQQRRSVTSLPPPAVEAINNAARGEIEQDFSAQCLLDSMYFSGKGFAKFAMMIYAVHDLAMNRELALKGLSKLKAALSVFIENKQINRLVYERAWKGVVSTAGLSGNDTADFGNTGYNDHHFVSFDPIKTLKFQTNQTKHFGYFVYTAAVIGYLDPSWLSEGNNVKWINMLVRDYANPVTDTHFPFSRAFDWYNGHSWAKGLFASGDGKDEESTSEDSFASYAIKMWGATIGDRAMEARGNLMLAIQARTFPMYFLMESRNTVQHRQLLGNKVTGILFENKIDHATYFVSYREKHDLREPNANSYRA